ncbi:FkbM family methyltransferase [Afifella marina]|uniref:Methyltransferase, FkbM family n=1 Tax=Afifella marina DSM 2698 TaxID=1120955 RepID=A0A1G5NDA5_AFIMA|nr:FkbM family methyltransferase [Afifella marina]MBK1623186.1 hypothetical protein [Afifella marina DSM 2698]MBK1626180.1 hypothetical protein [Afifella marina]MBK5917058.1 hypothetical protein [Afifella marina]RAI22050.1 hypothetical protein CH311_04890 [Afifella marina DSM 2698]SCZ34580.1 methyltransferase, FkbM family [Afifella marina DSM 2698]
MQPATSPEIVECRGVRLDLSHPLFTEKLRRAVERGWYEGAEARASEIMVRPGDRVVEFGGGCGFISSFMALTHADITIECVEANPELLALIEHHHRLNGVTCATLHHELAAREDGTADFYVTTDFWASSTRPGAEARRVEVPARAISKRLDEWDPQVVVMDVEGAELELLADPLPSKLRALVLELHPDIYGLPGVKAVMDGLSKQGFAYVPEGSEHAVTAWARVDALA